jgi:hypothetical protein
MLFHITIGATRNAPRLSFEVMAADSMTAAAQAADLCGDNEKIDVKPVIATSDFAHLRRRLP